MEIKKLDYSNYKGKRYSITVKSNKYLKILKTSNGFDLKLVDLEKEYSRKLEDDMLSDWLDDPIAYGAFENGILIGFVEGFLEKWNNRFRITNICIFESNNRKKGIGKKLLDLIIEDAKKMKARMVVLETQSYNYKAISFYEKNGFEIIGFDLYAYSNDAPREKNIRIEMGKIISNQ